MSGWSTRAGALLLVALVLVALAGAGLGGGRPAMAQTAPNVILDMPGILPGKHKAGLPDVKAAPLAWPRLDPGAALCQTPSDLDRLAANRAHTEGGGPVNCKIIQTPTAIQIVHRQDLGHTEVRVTDRADIVGWTDVWLPTKAPGGR